MKQFNRKRIAARIGIILLLGLVFYPYPSKAEQIKGEVVAVQTDGKSLSLKCPNPTFPILNENLEIVVLPYIQFVGLNSLLDLTAGDEVIVDALKNKKTKKLEAYKIEISKVKIREPIATLTPSPAPTNPSQGMGKGQQRAKK